MVPVLLVIVIFSHSLEIVSHRFNGVGGNGFS